MTTETFLAIILAVLLAAYFIHGVTAPRVERWKDKRRDIKQAREEAETYGRRFGPQ